MASFIEVMNQFYKEYGTGSMLRLYRDDTVLYSRFGNKLFYIL